ncbi:MAG: hypothetical protein GX896_00930 [Clostridiales bacterium]|nr:hypothetical protein [Clostridiales bacterium]
MGSRGTDKVRSGKAAGTPFTLRAATTLLTMEVASEGAGWATNTLCAELKIESIY